MDERWSVEIERHTPSPKDGGWQSPTQELKIFLNAEQAANVHAAILGTLAAGKAMMVLSEANRG